MKHTDTYGYWEHFPQQKLGQTGFDGEISPWVNSVLI